MNISNDPSVHLELINNGILDVIKKYIELFNSCAKTENKLGEDETIEGIDMDVIPIEALEVLKCVIGMAVNLTGNPLV